MACSMIPSFLFALLVLILVSGCASQSCSLSGEWKGTSAPSDDSNSLVVEDEFKFDEDGSYQLVSELSWLGVVDNNTCALTTEFSGTYSLSADDVLVTNFTTCEYTACTDDCGFDCDDGCIIESDTQTVSIEFSDNCDTFTAGQMTFSKEGSGWLVYAVVGVLFVAGAIVIVIGAAGAALFIKRRKTSQGAHGDSSYAPEELDL